ncbi:MAG: ATP synthase subunit I [Xanthomonadaceae bacterium]|jgi:F0F1-type ATP synthase assembly protein I|nr:ATP synthase subunit I [Xanthomonadaceae bacterium]
MLNSIAGGRQLAMRAIRWQAAAVAILALVLFSKGSDWAAAALWGGGGVVLGNWIAARMALSGKVKPAGSAFGWLLAGMAMKWLLVTAAILIALAGLQLPAVPVLLSVLTSMLAFILANSIRR